MVTGDQRDPLELRLRTLQTDHILQTKGDFLSLKTIFSDFSCTILETQTNLYKIWGTVLFPPCFIYFSLFLINSKTYFKVVSLLQFHDVDIDLLCTEKKTELSCGRSLGKQNFISAQWCSFQFFSILFWRIELSLIFAVLVNLRQYQHFFYRLGVTTLQGSHLNGGLHRFHVLFNDTLNYSFLCFYV